jgi:AcrR family transcriptional regulator
MIQAAEAPPQAAAQARRRKPQARGLRTRQVIIETAIELLRSNGAAGFSVDQVADAMGISRGNLNYHYPRRDDVIRAMAEALLERYRVRFDVLCARISVRGDNDLGEIVEWLLEDALDPPTAELFPQLFALAGHDTVVSDTVDRLYSEATRALVRSLDLDPDDPRTADLQDHLYLLASLIEGTTLLFGRAGPAEARSQRHLQLARAAVTPLLERSLAEARKRA